MTNPFQDADNLSTLSPGLLGIHCTGDEDKNDVLPGGRWDRLDGHHDGNFSDEEPEQLFEDSELYETRKCCGCVSPRIVHWTVVSAFWLFFLLCSLLEAIRIATDTKTTESPVFAWLRVVLMVYLCGMVCAHEKNLFKSRKHTCLRLLVAPLYLFLAFELVDQRRMTAASLRPDQNQMMSWWSHLTSNEDGLTAITWLTMTSVVFAVLVAISQIFVAFALERMTRSQYVRWLAAEEARQAERKALKSQASSRGKNGQYKAVGSSATNNEHIGIGVGGSMTRSPTGSSKNV